MFRLFLSTIISVHVLVIQINVNLYNMYGERLKKGQIASFTFILILI